MFPINCNSTEEILLLIIITITKKDGRAYAYAYAYATWTVYQFINLDFQKWWMS